jgi:glyoxylase-like metal-dependent hydrolase (beta-lactamase superfamily II)
MPSTVTEIAPSVYRISTFHPDYGMQFNQFLVADDEPVLVHTGFRKSFPTTRDAVATVLDPATLRWITFSHFEADECGALNEWPADPAPFPESDVVGPARDAIFANRGRPFANDVPYTAHTHATLERLAGLELRTLAIMHGSSFRGDRGRALRELAVAMREALGG